VAAQAGVAAVGLAEAAAQVEVGLVAAVGVVRVGAVLEAEPVVRVAAAQEEELEGKAEVELEAKAEVAREGERPEALAEAGDSLDPIRSPSIR